MINKGTKLSGRYVIDSIIGEGGGGVVYKAFDSNLQSYVVVKQIKEDVASFLECRTEVDILKGLKHQSLPKVLDFFEDDQKIYTVMDFIEGCSLSEALKQEGRFGQKQVLGWAGQLARALACLHSQNPPIIHSDVKPANIMWDRKTNHVCLIDFNISLALNKGKREVTWLSGGYSPPEQYQTLDHYRSYLEKATGTTIGREQRESTGNSRSGQSDSRPTKVFDRRTLAAVNQIVTRTINESSDIYSFGTTIYHLLTGVRPGVDFLEIPPISRYDIDLSEGFCHIIERCMEIDPARRYQNGMELFEALEKIYELDSEYQAFRKKRFWNKMLCTVLVAGGIAMAGSGVVVHERGRLSSYQNYVEQAKQLLEENEYEAAADLIGQARKLDESKVEADELELLSLYQQGNYEACVERGLGLLGQKHYVLKDDDDRRRMGNLYYIMGNAYLDQEESKKALDYFAEALKYETENPLFYRDYAIALARSGKTEQAESVLDEARLSKLSQDSIDFVTGEISYARKDYLNAQGMLLDVIGRTQDLELRERAILLLNRMYLQCGPEYFDTAIAMLEQEMNAGDGIWTIHLAEALANDYLRREESLNDSVKALNVYISMYNSGYKTMRMMENIGILYREMGREEEADRMADQMLSQYPDDYRGHKLLAFLELDKQQKLSNETRNYNNFQICYQNAQTLYRKRSAQTDSEMQLLEQMDEELRAGGWYKEGYRKP